MSSEKSNYGGLIGWVDNRLPVFSYLNKEYGEYPTPRNFNYWWNFGALAMFCLTVLIVSGIFLAMQYQPNTELAFSSVQRIMRDVNYGWLMRYIHMNGASFFFIAVYIHLFRGLYYGSYKSPRELLWMLGVVLLLLMMATSFFGYVLPWGQMSFWGATVITNLFSAIPVIGDPIVAWLWGGFAIDNPTLNRFYALHYLLPFVIVGVVGMHVIALHVVGSGNPTGIEPKSSQDTIPFHPYYTAKDGFGLSIFIIVYALFVFYWPEALGEAENYVQANRLQTPNEIVPEWYLLPYYAILRSVPDLLIVEAKLAGVIAMFLSILVLFVLPWLDTSKVRSARYRPIYKKLFWLFIVVCFVLGWVGAHPPNHKVFGLEWLEAVDIGRIGTAYYFLHFFVLFPLLGKVEKTRPVPNSIAESVLGVQATEKS